MSAPADVLLYVQHLLGIGHLRRAAAIARALADRGLRVVFVTGGLPATDLDIGSANLVQLPPLKSRDEAFSALVDEADRPVDEAWKERRAARLLEAFHDSRPHLLLTEMFPFGRRQMRFELLPLLAAVAERSPRPAVVCSVRDILNEPQKPEKTAWILETLNRHFDRVLVHGDPAVIPLEATFPEVARIVPEVSYTGYVVTAAPEKSDGTRRDGAGEVLVSAGGGRVAGPLIEAALAARPLGPLAAAPWRILVGQHYPEAAFRDLARRAPDGVIVERSRPDFQALLARCRLSISQAGYNTVMEVLRAGRPAVVVPFAGVAETEQTRRAELLQERGALALVSEAELTGARLDQAVRRALAPGGARPAIRMDGAETTAAILQRMLARVAP